MNILTRQWQCTHQQARTFARTQLRMCACAAALIPLGETNSIYVVQLDLAILSLSLHLSLRSVSPVGRGGTVPGFKSPLTEPLDYGTKPGHFETSIIHFSTSEEVSEMSEASSPEQANE